MKINIENTALTVIGICVAVITLVVAVYGILVIIKSCEATKINNLHDRIKVQKERIDFFINKLDDILVQSLLFRKINWKVL